MSTKSQKHEAQGSKKLLIPDEVKFKMSLHRDLVLGNGFFSTLHQRAGDTRSLGARLEHCGLESNSQPTLEPAKALSLPVVNLLRMSQLLTDALMEEIFPGDRQRLHAYLSNAPLGFGLITGVS